jgi:hypothetical protein
MGVVRRHPAVAGLTLTLLGSAFIYSLGGTTMEILAFGAGGLSWAALYAILGGER